MPERRPSSIDYKTKAMKPCRPFRPLVSTLRHCNTRISRCVKMTVLEFLKFEEVVMAKVGYAVRRSHCDYEQGHHSLSAIVVRGGCRCGLLSPQVSLVDVSPPRPPEFDACLASFFLGGGGGLMTVLLHRLACRIETQEGCSIAK